MWAVVATNTSIGLDKFCFTEYSMPRYYSLYSFRAIDSQNHTTFISCFRFILLFGFYKSEFLRVADQSVFLDYYM